MLLVNVRNLRVPLECKQFKHKSTPWMTPSMLVHLKQLDKLYKTYSKDITSDTNWMTYKQARNYCTKAICGTKSAYLLSLSTCSRTFWTAMTSCTGLGKHRPSTLARPCSSPSIYKHSANRINSFFFLSVSNIIGAQQQPLKKALSNDLPQVNHQQPFL